MGLIENWVCQKAAVYFQNFLPKSNFRYTGTLHIEKPCGDNCFCVSQLLSWPSCPC